MKQILATIFVLGFPSIAVAQCQSDNDCKGERICESGACVTPAAVQCMTDNDCAADGICEGGVCFAPAAALAPVPPQAPVYYPQQVPTMALTPPQLGYPDRPPSPGWSTAGAVVGFVGGVVVLGLAIGAEATIGDGMLPVGLGATAITLSIPCVIIPAVASSSVHGASGMLGLKVGGWIGWGLAVVDGLAQVGLGIADKDVPHGLPALAGVLGFAGAVMLSIDALVAGSRARRAAAEYAQLDNHRPRPVVVPIVSRGARGEAITGAMLAMQF